MSIIAFPAAKPNPQSLNVKPLARMLAEMGPEAHALILPGESIEDSWARRNAFWDMQEEFLADYDGASYGGDALDALAALGLANILDGAA